MPPRARPLNADGPDEQWWRQQIRERLTSAPVTVAVATPRKRMGSNFAPALVFGADGQRYVAKGLQEGRSLGRRLFADHVVGRLGKMIGAPVAEVALLSLARDVAEGNFATMHLQPGILHGSVYLDGFELGYEVEHLDVPENRDRFARLAVLYGWAFAEDHQYLYRRTKPQLVVSHDHDYFLHGAPEWDASTLAAAPPSQPDAMIVASAFLSPESVARSAESLARLELGAIADAVAFPPPSWGVGLDERVALATYFGRRRRELLDDVQRGS